jgi:hypothetical protein
MRANYVRTLYLPERHPMSSTYAPHYQSRIPPHCSNSKTCHCGREKGGEEVTKYAICIEACDVEECARKKALIMSILQVMKHITCESCSERFPDTQSLDSHVKTLHVQNLVTDIVPK